MVPIDLLACPADAVAELSDPALAGRARDGDQAALGELVARHGLAMTRFEEVVGLAVTSRPDERIRRLVGIEHLPLRAAWLIDRASGYVHDDDDAFLLARFTELTTAWRTALWHAEVEGDSPAAIGRLLGLGPSEATATVRSARSHLLWSVVESTPAGSDQDCIDTAALLCNAGADARRVLALAAAHGRHCDDCMLLVKRALRFASSLRDSLLRPLAGDLAVGYSAARPPAYRPGPRTDLGALVAHRGRPAAVTAVMGVAAAAAVAAMAMGPGALPAYVKPDREVTASPVEGQLLLRTRPQAAPSITEQVVTTRFAPEDLSVTLPDHGPRDQDSQQQDPGTGVAPDGSQEPTGDTGTGTPGDGQGPDGPFPGTDGPEAPGGDSSSPGSSSPGSVVPPVHVEAGPITVDTTGDEPLVTVDGPIPVEVPALPEVDLGAVTDTTSGVVTGLLG